jgi:hypothetical protein
LLTYVIVGGLIARIEMAKFSLTRHVVAKRCAALLASLTILKETLAATRCFAGEVDFVARELKERAVGWPNL